MRKKKAKKIAASLAIILCMLLFVGMGGERQTRNMTQEEYQQRLRAQAKYHKLLNAGDQAQKDGNNKLAAQYYEQAFQLAKGSSLEGVSRGELSRIYEKMNMYDKALEHVEWILKKADQTSPLYPKYIEAKARLLKKIEEQKLWEAKQDPVVPKFKEGFKQASPEKQKEFLEGLGGSGIMDIFKEAMVAEHGGDFKKALGIYEGLIPRKAEVEKELGIDGWVMLYPAIQRNAEMLGDTAKEKEALLWMKGNLLPDNATFHASLSKLLPQSVAHIEKRIKDYKL